ncbi:ATP-binding cassette domain-containing protein [Lentzea nigeriaca]|uniref:ATP-binding cassette domain-containing protein n=1 Tax=Lentzea nigeriaca TaxID=1128665 RepID=UPI0027DCF5F3|nr:ATP-binding cassette domain-containing protein [Lentzea nigeriaca]MBM7857063.1 putative ABC transport system ATP-binding protein [Lentzea nigeriaca]
MRSAGGVVIRAAGVHRSFDGVSVLRGVDLAVSAGELVTLSGPSGSGKTALLSLLCGFDSPDSGTVSPGLASWSDCAVLPQSLGLASELTLEENVALPLRLAGRAVDGVSGLLAELGIDGLGARYPGQVSFGQQQRAALARAVVARPAALLADEPTAHLDAASAVAAVGLLRRVADEGAAVLIATHHDAVHAVADRVLELVDGQVQG